MNSSKISIKLSARDMTSTAMVLQGVSPSVMAIKPGSRVHKNRKHAASVGKAKHRHRMFD